MPYKTSKVDRYLNDLTEDEKMSMLYELCLYFSYNHNLDDNSSDEEITLIEDIANIVNDIEDIEDNCQLPF